MKKVNKLKHQKQLIEKAKKLMAQIEKLKEAYSELDRVTSLLMRTGFEEGRGFYIRDNFAITNTVYKTTAVKRYELKPIKK